LEQLISNLEMLYSSKILNWQVNGEFKKAERCLEFARTIVEAKDLRKNEFLFDIHKADETDVLNWMKGYAQIKGYSCKETQRVVTFSEIKTTMSIPALHFTN
jgi:predicted RNase H-related nuclease YkuK (DUF458 family)